MQNSFSGSVNSLDTEMLFDNMPSAVLVVDYNLTIQMANKPARLITDGMRKEIVGMKPGEVFRCVNRCNTRWGCGTGSACKTCFTTNLITDLISERQPKMSAEGQIDLENHGKLDLKITAINLFEDQAVLVIIDDQTELKKLEREREMNDKLQGAVETAGAICHEMNQPLQVISGYLELMIATGNGQDNNNAKYLKISKNQLDRLTVIIRKLNNLRQYRTDKYPGGTDILDIAKSSAQQPT